MEETVYLGGGCFWCTEAIFSEIRGVKMVEPGYSGGSVPNPSYEQVCTDETGHAEVVKVTFDNEQIELDELLTVFFMTHDPTTPNRQGNDVGTQYRSIILYTNQAQKETAEKVMKKMETDVWKKKIVTELVPFKAFYPAEEYHRNYFKRNSEQPYCRLVIAPKVSKLREHYSNLLKH
ncbi:MAG: peptide-methionine (S)-S-oxide reductase MsrA [Conexivisphaerales archaeon]